MENKEQQNAKNSKNVHSQVELYIQCNSLPKMDTFSDIDPIVVVYSVEKNQEIEIGRTEFIDNDPNPKFRTRIPMPYHFEQIQDLRFHVYHKASSSSDVNEQIFIGSCETTLGEIIAGQKENTERRLKNKNNYVLRAHDFSTIWIHVESLRKESMEMEFRMCATLHHSRIATGLQLQIFKQAGQGKFVPVYTSEVVANTRIPSWEPISVNWRTLCNSDPNTVLRVDIFKRTYRKTTELIGSVFCTPLHLAGSQQCLDMGVEEEIKDVRPISKMAIMRDGRERGNLYIDDCLLSDRAGFLEYVKAGMQINLVCAVDFTSSNGDPSESNSLHHISSNGSMQNDYYRAMERVAKVLIQYDSDGLIPFYGFGAEVDQGMTSHCFHVNLSAQPEVKGVNGLLSAYMKVFPHIRFDGPTYFSPIIRKVSEQARGAPFHQQEQSYYILLLLTDGVITDFQQTIDAIVEATNLPLSIIIVGIGRADFKKMEVLDADDTPLQHSDGRTMQRDIVQFVPFRNFQGKNVEQLSDAILEEIPNQVTSFAHSQRVPPIKRRQVPSISPPNVCSPYIEIEEPGEKEGLYPPAQLTM